MNKNVIYTCVTGGYDKIERPNFISEGFDYVCYTDDHNLKSDIWEIRQIPEKLLYLGNAKINRYIKLHPHELFPEYDLSIYIDGNVDLKADINEFIEDRCSDGDVFFYKHPYRDCIYDEMDAVVSGGQENKEIVNAIRARYEKEGFPKHFGLSQNNIIIRRHNEKNCMRLMTLWWNEVFYNSYRDQLSLFYVIWKNPDIKVKILEEYLWFSKYFWGRLHTRKK